MGISDKSNSTSTRQIRPRRRHLEAISALEVTTQAQMQLLRLTMHPAAATRW